MSEAHEWIEHARPVRTLSLVDKILHPRKKISALDQMEHFGMARQIADIAGKQTTVNTGAAFACAGLAPTTTVKPTTKTTA